MATNDLSAARDFLRRHFPQGGRVLCAVSGGLDSICLVHFLDTWGRRNGFSPAAAHFNHRLRGEAANRDQRFVEAWCAGRGIPCFSGSGDTRGEMARRGRSLEECARDLRYAFLQETAQREGFPAILTAHHADDNAETMLLNLIRGTGTAGLAGIPPVRGNVYRPFLGLSRETLADYARFHNLPHVEDETNREEIAARNVLRHQVFPVLRQLNPRAAEHMCAAAGVLAREHAALEEQAQALVRQAADTPQGLSIPCAVLAEAPRAAAERAALHLLAAAAGHRRDLTAAHAEALVSLARSGQDGAQVSLPYGLTARLGGYTLYLEHIGTPPPPADIAPGQTAHFGPWQVRLSRSPGPGALVLAPTTQPLHLTAWRAADRMTLPGSRGSRSLKRLCAERGIPPLERDALPVLRVGNAPAAVPGVGVDVNFAPGGGDALFVSFIKKTEETGHEK